MSDAREARDPIIETIIKHIPHNQDFWEVLGLLNRRYQVLAFGSDSKIIGRVFEIIVEPILAKAAEELGFELGESEQQTVYPDFWFKKPNGRYIGIDIKSTYRKYRQDGSLSPFNFTLGAYSSFMRNGTKNIYGKYSDYDSHYVIGFLYSRNTNATSGATTLENAHNILTAYKDVEFFIQEKYKIGGQKKGSGNTNNIATFKSNSIEDFKNGFSYFTYLGEDVFNDYWKHYPLYTDVPAIKASLYTNLESYFEWLKNNGNEKRGADLMQIYTNWLKEIGTPNSIN